ncbi:MAG: hypothetical protein CVV04_11870 [Firmicutes bacterium HGW-Firmicutes-9]|jgi:hypothetical protein|nr:MAG: hypothetical protein CVV04_11870 [Firmicutes bacterium HGW-Firmicutes-9]
MQVLYMHMPELPHTRHIIVGEKHIINTAAPESTIFHKITRRECANQEMTSNKLRVGKKFHFGS